MNLSRRLGDEDLSTAMDLEPDFENRQKDKTDAADDLAIIVPPGTLTSFVFFLAVNEDRKKGRISFWCTLHILQSQSCFTNPLDLPYCFVLSNIGSFQPKTKKALQDYDTSGKNIFCIHPSNAYARDPTSSFFDCPNWISLKLSIDENEERIHVKTAVFSSFFMSIKAKLRLQRNPMFAKKSIALENGFVDQCGTKEDVYSKNLPWSDQAYFPEDICWTMFMFMEPYLKHDAQFIEKDQYYLTFGLHLKWDDYEIDQGGEVFAPIRLNLAKLYTLGQWTFFKDKMRTETELNNNYNIFKSIFRHRMNSTVLKLLSHIIRDQKYEEADNQEMDEERRREMRDEIANEIDLYRERRENVNYRYEIRSDSIFAVTATFVDRKMKKIHK